MQSTNMHYKFIHGTMYIHLGTTVSIHVFAVEQPPSLPHHHLAKNATCSPNVGNNSKADEPTENLGCAVPPSSLLDPFLLDVSQCVATASRHLHQTASKVTQPQTWG